MHLPARILILLVFLLFFLSAKTAVHAIELTFTDPPLELNVNDSFSVNVTISGASDSSEYYIQGRFTHENKTRYFGFTKNNSSEWKKYKQDHTAFFKTQGNGTWTIEFKPDTEHEEYEGEGNYFFNIWRYTEGGTDNLSSQDPALIILTESSTEASPTSKSTSTPTPTPTPEPTATPVPNIILSEVMACPNSGEKEWVEIQNLSSFTAELTDWLIRDNTESNKKTFSANIGANQFATVELSSILNNSGDSVRLLNQHGEQLSSMSYQSCDTGLSWVNSNGTWQQTTAVTKNSSNSLVSPTSEPTASPTPTNSPTPNPTSTPNETTSNSTTQSDSESTGDETESDLAYSLPDISPAAGEILGEHTESSASASNSTKEKSSSSHKSGIIAVLIGSVLLLGVSGYFVKEWYNRQIGS